MKIICRCGNILCDNTDAIPYKGHFIADQDWFEFLDKIEAAVKSTELDKERVLNQLMSDTGKLHRTMYQCPQCGRLYVDDTERELCEFVPNKAMVDKHLLGTGIRK